jgi:tetratricopeptide (TPR) repeat protein
MNREKINKFLDDYKKTYTPDYHQDAFLLGLCHIQLGEYTTAQAYFKENALSMFTPPMFWKDAGSPEWLVDIFVLSGCMELHKAVLKELDLYKKHPLYGYSNIALYAYGLMELLYPTGWDISISINGLTKKDKWKFIYALGWSIKAIIEDDHQGLINALIALLKAHEGMAKHGVLRETSEGFICMSAMSLAFAAFQHNITVDLENEYFSLGYLHFLINLNKK